MADLTGTSFDEGDFAEDEEVEEEDVEEAKLREMSESLGAEPRVDYGPDFQNLTFHTVDGEPWVEFWDAGDNHEFGPQEDYIPAYTPEERDLIEFIEKEKRVLLWEGLNIESLFREDEDAWKAAGPDSDEEGDEGSGSDGEKSDESANAGPAFEGDVSLYGAQDEKDEEIMDKADFYSEYDGFDTVEEWLAAKGDEALEDLAGSDSDSDVGVDPSEPAPKYIFKTEALKYRHERDKAIERGKQLHHHHVETCYNQFALALKFADILETIETHSYTLALSENPLIQALKVPDLPDWVRAHFIFAVEFEDWNAAGKFAEDEEAEYVRVYRERVVWDDFKEELQDHMDFDFYDYMKEFVVIDKDHEQTAKSSAMESSKAPDEGNDFDELLNVGVFADPDANTTEAEQSSASADDSDGDAQLTIDASAESAPYQDGDSDDGLGSQSESELAAEYESDDYASQSDREDEDKSDDEHGSQSDALKGAAHGSDDDMTALDMMVEDAATYIDTLDNEFGANLTDELLRYDTEVRLQYMEDRMQERRNMEVEDAPYNGFPMFTTLQDKAR